MTGLTLQCSKVVLLAIVTLTLPWSSDVFTQSGIKDGVVAKRWEERKEAKYSKLYSSTGEKSSVVLLVF